MRIKSSMKESGFTLVEMALVLVVIGLILGAVSIGKDLQRTSEYKKIKQKFVDQWEQGYNQHYIRTGVVLGDSQAEPTLAVHGNETDDVRNTFLSIVNGDYSEIAPPSRICQGTTIDTYDGKRDAGGIGLHSYMDAAGIKMPPGRAEGREDRYVYLDSNGNPQELQICFQWNAPGTTSNSGNVMVIAGMTPDLARMLDEMIDGQANAGEGRFREQLASASTPSKALWSFTNSHNIDNDDGAASGENRDEDQIKVVTAHYKMNQ